jgi:hypothetical protein
LVPNLVVGTRRALNPLLVCLAQAAARKAADSPAAKVAQLQQQMEALGGPPLQKLKAAVAELRAGIAAAEEEASRKRAQVKTTTAGAARLQAEAADAAGEKSAAAAKVEALRADFAAIEEAAAAGAGTWIAAACLFRLERRARCHARGLQRHATKAWAFASFKGGFFGSPTWDPGVVRFATGVGGGRLS